MVFEKIGNALVVSSGATKVAEVARLAFDDGLYVKVGQGYYRCFAGGSTSSAKLKWRLFFDDKGNIREFPKDKLGRLVSGE
jgi:hypothetical protein